MNLTGWHQPFGSWGEYDHTSLVKTIHVFRLHNFYQLSAVNTRRILPYHMVDHSTFKHFHICCSFFICVWISVTYIKINQIIIISSERTLPLPSLKSFLRLYYICVLLSFPFKIVWDIHAKCCLSLYFLNVTVGFGFLIF